MAPVVSSRRLPAETEEHPHRAGPATRAFTRAVVWARYPIVVLWIAAAVAATMYLPNLGSGAGSSPEGLVNMNAEAIQSQLRGYQAFGYPLLSEIAVVEHRAEGMSDAAQTRAVQRALDFEQLGIQNLAFALPVPNTVREVPGTRTPSTTVVTYLYFGGGAGLSEQYAGAKAYAAAARQDPEAGDVGVTGAIAARVEAEDEIDEALPYVEIGTVAIVALVLGIALRSLLAPLLTLFVAGISYLVALRVVPAVGDLLDVPVPRELRPLVLVLLLAIVTDYCVFFLTEMRRRLTMGEQRLEAAYCTGIRIVPIVVTAGLIVAAGTGTLILGSLGFFRALGPGMAVTAIVGTVVALTLVPALLAICGHLVFRGAIRRARDGGANEAPSRRELKTRARLRTVAEHRGTAIGIAIACIAGLGALAYQARDARLGFTLIEGLPSDAPSRVAAENAAQGFAAGIVAPTEILIEGQGVSSRMDSLVSLQASVEQLPGVAGTVGPREQAAADRAEGETKLPDAFVSADGNTARMLVVLDADPFSAEAIDRVGDLREAMPTLLQRTGLQGDRASLAGQTGLADETVQESLDNVVKLAAAALLVNLFFLILFLRAIIAPIYLLFSSVLALGATYGLTWLVVQALGWGEITYYVPFAAAVLLLSLGSDYTIFVVGRIWEAARDRPVAEAVVDAAPRASGSISVAGLVMALSFAVLWIVPVVPLRELALMMTIGVLLDAFVVRTLLAPALVTAFGRFGAWPGGELGRDAGDSAEARVEPAAPARSTS